MRAMFTISAPQTGAQMPSDAELERLLAIVRRAHPWLVKDDGPEAFDLESFKTAFWATTLFFRTHAPRQDRRFMSFVEHVVDVHDVFVFGPAFLSAVISTGEVPWQRQDLAAGRTLEVGLDPYAGLTSRNTWRDILSGRASLLAPVARKMPGQAPSDLPSVRVYRM